MKIALVNGQKHKRFTYHIGRMFTKKLTDPDNIEYVFISRDLPEFCRECTKAFNKKHPSPN